MLGISVVPIQHPAATPELVVDAVSGIGVVRHDRFTQRHRIYAGAPRQPFDRAVAYQITIPHESPDPRHQRTDESQSVLPDEAVVANQICGHDRRAPVAVHRDNEVVIGVRLVDEPPSGNANGHQAWLAPIHVTVNPQHLASVLPMSN